jgi:hypothetical protein
MNRMRVTRKALELKFKGKGPMGKPRARWFCQALQVGEKREENWQEIKKGLRKNMRLETFHLSYINRNDTRRRNLL